MLVSIGGLAGVALKKSRRSAVGGGAAGAGAVLLCLAAPAAALCMAVAHLVGGFVLLAMQFPNGETGTADNDQLSSMWVGDRGLAFVAASWTMAGFASLIIVTEAGVLRPGLEAVERVLYRRDHHRRDDEPLDAAVFEAREGPKVERGAEVEDRSCR